MADRRNDREGRSPGESSRGLTLIEVLLAMAILGVGLAVIFQGIGLGLRVRRDSEDLQRIIIVADRELNGLLIAGTAPEDPQSGEEDGISWTVEQDPSLIEGKEEEGGEETLFPVRITVTAVSGRSREITTLLPGSEE